MIDKKAKINKPEGLKSSTLRVRTLFINVGQRDPRKRRGWEPRTEEGPRTQLPAPIAPNPRRGSRRRKSLSRWTPVLLPPSHSSRGSRREIGLGKSLASSPMLPGAECAGRKHTPRPHEKIRR